MKNRKYCSKSFSIFLLIFFSLMMLAFSSETVSAASTWYVAPSPAGSGLSGGSCLAPGFNTISGAITVSSSGDTINVCAGTYTEQVTITKSLTIVGAGTATTFLDAPAVLTGNRVIVTISGSGVNVDFSGMTVQGPINGLGAGFSVQNGANAVIHNNNILNINDNPPNGSQHGWGIIVGASSNRATNYQPYFPVVAGSATATISNNLISGYQKNGIIISNSGSNGLITNNIITGLGLIDYIAQNGIVIENGAGATITNNTVSRNEFLIDNSNKAAQCSPVPSNINNLTEVYNDCVNAVGILLYNAGNVISIDNNTVTGNDDGLALLGSSNPLINFNAIYANRYFGIDASADTNTIDGTNNDYHKCFPIQSAFAIADVSLNVNYVPFIAPGCIPAPTMSPYLMVLLVGAMAVIGMMSLKRKA